MSRLGDAITTTAALGMFLFFGGIALFWLGFGIAVLIIAPILLVPLGLIALVVAFFYFTFRPKATKRMAQDFSWLSGPGPSEAGNGKDPQARPEGPRSA